MARASIKNACACASKRQKETVIVFCASPLRPTSSDQTRQNVTHCGGRDMKSLRDVKFDKKRLNDLVQKVTA